MGTPIQKEFGPGYDSPPRKFHFWAVILPTVVLIALAVALMRDTGSTSTKLTRSPIVSLPEADVPRTRGHGVGAAGQEDVDVRGRIERS